MLITKPILHRLLAPAVQLMEKMRLSTKLLVVFSLAMLPLSILVIHTVISALEPMRTTRDQLAGTAVLRPLFESVNQAQRVRDLHEWAIAGADEAKAPLKAARSALQASLNAVDSQLAENDGLALAADWNEVRKTLAQLATDPTSEGKSEFAKHIQALDAGRRFISLVAEKSALTLQHDARLFFLVELAVRRVVPWQESISQLRGLSMGVLQRDVADLAERTAIQTRLFAISQAQERIEEDLAALERSGESRPPIWAASLEQSKALTARAKSDLLGDLLRGSPAEFGSQSDAALAKVTAFQTALLERLQEQLTLRKSSLDNNFAMLSIAIVVLAILLNYLLFGFYYVLTNGMLSMHNTVSRTADGDLTATLKIGGRDELATTAAMIDGMTGSLSALVANIRTNAAMVAQAADTLLAGTNELNIRTDQQATALRETSRSVAQLSDNVHKNADSAQSADTLAIGLRQIGENSGDAMQAAVKSMEGIQTSAVKIREMVTLIDDIAFQTNILALNAAVEAARAGEQGRGFAVVAAEVRNLAQRSGTAAKEIRTLINESANQVGSGVNQIREANKRMNEVVTGIRTVAGELTHISTASAAQSQGLVQITAALDNLDTITQSNGEMAEKTRNAAQHLEQRAIALNEAVSHFRLRQGTAEEAFAMVNEAVHIFRQRGRSALRSITANEDKRFADRDMYVFAFDRNGQYSAAGGLPARVGVNLRDLPGLDGERLVSDAFKQNEDGGWVDYTIVNPVSKNVEHKTSFIARVDADLVIGCGVYKVM